MNKNKIWIDLDNSPHVLFFKPIIEEFIRRDINVVVTIRDFAQVAELTKLHNISNTKIGSHYGKSKILKIFGLFIRSLQMIPFYLKNKPDAVLSHGSRSMNIIATLLGLKIYEATDYEHAKHIPFVKCDILFVPESINSETVSRLASKIEKFPGIKEDVYVPFFQPSNDILNILNINPNDILVAIRPPATEAHYHTKKSDELFFATLKYLIEHPKTKLVMLPRTQNQKDSILSKWIDQMNNKIIIPEYALNGLDLVWNSDLVISGGGTMIREATALGVPAYSIFGGKVGAVDRYLESKGRLNFINNVDDVRNKIKVEKRIVPELKEKKISQSLNVIVNVIEQDLRK